MKRLMIIILLLLSKGLQGDTELPDTGFWEHRRHLRHVSNIIDRLQVLESQNDPKAFNKREQAAGILQIRPIMVREINRLLREERYTLEDRWCPDTSREMFITYQNIVNPTWDEELACKKWNGGIQGNLNPKTEKYYQKFLKL
jgi:hypothetical protein